MSKRQTPFLGASAPWVDDAEATYEHVKRELARELAERLKNRLEGLEKTDLSTEELATELRRQMAECAVDGNLVLAGELSEATWNLLQWRETEGVL